MKTNLLLEIAARAPMDAPFESAVNYEGVMTDVHKYRFDLRSVCGDYEVVIVPMAFSSESSARMKLFEMLVETYGK